MEFLFIWPLIGLVLGIYLSCVDIKNGMNLTLGDTFVILIVAPILGPILLLELSDMVIVKGKRK